MTMRSGELAGMQETLSHLEGNQRSATNLVMLLASFGMLGLTISLYQRGSMDFGGVLACTAAMWVPLALQRHYPVFPTI